MPRTSGKDYPNREPQSLFSSYSQNTNELTKSIDVFLIFAILLGLVQLIYGQLTGHYQYNGFLGSFISVIGAFVFAGTAGLWPPIDTLGNFRLKSSLGKAELSPPILLLEFIAANIALGVVVAFFLP